MRVFCFEYVTRLADICGIACRSKQIGRYDVLESELEQIRFEIRTRKIEVGDVICSCIYVFSRYPHASTYYRQNVTRNTSKMLDKSFIRTFAIACLNLS